MRFVTELVNQTDAAKLYGILKAALEDMQLEVTALAGANELRNIGVRQGRYMVLKELCDALGRALQNRNNQ